MIKLAKIYTDADAEITTLLDKTMAVIGYGSQGSAQAKNMKDFGLHVIMGLRPNGASWKKAKAEDFTVYSVSDAAERGDVIMMMIPDLVQLEVYEKSILPHMKEGKVLCFAHGFNIHFRQIIPPPYVDVVMVAPKAPGAMVRESFEKGWGVPALFAVHQDVSGKAKEIALAIAKAIGCTRVGVLETTFKEETESDLIGEQTVLVGGLMELIKRGFEVLVEAGYQPELAYFEVCNEAKLIMDLVYERGMTGMLEAVSDTAKYGGLAVGPKIIDDRVKENMKKAVKDVQSGEFAKEWIKEHAKGMRRLKKLSSKLKEHQLEKVGRTIRKMAGIEK